MLPYKAPEPQPDVCGRFRSGSFITVRDSGTRGQWLQGGIRVTIAFRHSAPGLQDRERDRQGVRRSIADCWCTLDDGIHDPVLEDEDPCGDLELINRASVRRGEELQTEQGFGLCCKPPPNPLRSFS